MAEIRDMLYPYQVNQKEYIDEKKKILAINSWESSDYIEDSEKYKKISWIYDTNQNKEKDSNFKYPSIAHSYKLYKALCHLLKIHNDITEKECVRCFLDEAYRDCVKDMLIKCIENANKSKSSTTDNKKAIEELINEEKRLSNLPEEVGEFSLIKGSIYKIKRYFLEDNNIKSIRGGSIMIDYLNNNYIKEYLKKKESLESSYLIYSGGGNILMMVPRKEAKTVCKELEKDYQEYGLTLMSAFEFIDTDIYNFLFNYKNLMTELNNSLKERQRVRMFDFERSTSSIDKITLKSGEPPIPLSGKAIISRGICELCHCRDAQYFLEESEPSKIACASCYRKYIIGKTRKSKFREEYENVLKKKGKYVKGDMVQTLDDLQDFNGMIAVIYGDGNNMGQYVMNISAPFEMMYFSDKTDQITKESVYCAMAETMGEDTRFEILAIGGDDLFFVVPAEYAPSLAVRVIEHFDDKFGHQATMSIGMCIAKYHTPVKAMFEIAKDNLKEAKKYAKKENEERNNKKIEDEGTVDIIELSGAQDVINATKYKGIFPMRASTLKKVIEKIPMMQGYKLRMIDYNYAQKNMQKEEYNLYFTYKEAQSIKQREQLGIRVILEELLGEMVNNIYLQEHNPWAELVMLMKYGKGIENAKGSVESNHKNTLTS